MILATSRGAWLLWVILPYLAIATFVVGTVWRYRADQLRWTTRSTQLLESRWLKLGSPLFHFGLLAVIGGHADVGVLTGGGNVFRELTKACRSGALVALLADRDLTKGGTEVDFCGQRARMAVGPAALAVSTGAALHPCIVHYEPHPNGHGWRTVVTFHPAVPLPTQGTSREKVQVMTQACADVLTEAVREHTQDWHMMQRVFTRDLDDDGPSRHPAPAGGRR